MNGIGSAGMGIGGKGFSTIARSGFDSPDSRRRGKAGGRVPPRGLVMWCMGSANTLGGTTWTGTASGNKISVWRDFSGNRNHMLQGTGAKKPSINRRVQNKKDAITLAAAEFMLSKSASACDFGAGQFDIYMIYQGSDVSATKVVYSNTSAINATGFDLRRFANETFKGKLYNSGAKQTAATVSLSGKGYFFTRFHRKSDDAVELIYDTADGTAGTKAVSGGSDKDISAGKFALGALTNGGSGSPMNCAEVLIYNRDLSAKEAANVKSYLSDKYGLGL